MSSPGCDLSEWRPWVLIVEATSPQSTAQTHTAWEPGIVEHGYEFAMFDGLNRYYVASDHADLLGTLSYPVCVFDQPYVRADVASRIKTLAGELAAANESVAATTLAVANAEVLVGEFRVAVETRDELLAAAATKAQDDARNGRRVAHGDEYGET